MAVAAGVAFLGALAIGALADDAPKKWIVVPPGNRSSAQPEISASSIKRTAETKGTFDAKFAAVYDSLAADKELIAKIVKVADRYGIDPIHMIGAIVG